MMQQTMMIDEEWLEKRKSWNSTRWREQASSRLASSFSRSQDWRVIFSLVNRLTSDVSREQQSA
jgi:hypothetical protein